MTYANAGAVKPTAEMACQRCLVDVLIGYESFLTQFGCRGITMSHDEKVADIASRVAELISEAYERGWKDGAADARHRILRAAESESGISSAALAPTHPASHGGQSVHPVASLPRGTLRPVVTAIMSQNPGKSLSEITRLVVKADPRISPYSVGNEVRRNNGKMYKSIKSKWYIIAGAASSKVADATTQNSPQGETGAVAAPASVVTH